MAIESTEYLSKLSHSEIKEVRQKWPNPLIPLAGMLGGVGGLMFGVMKAANDELPDSEKLGLLLGGVAVFILLVFGATVFTFIKLAKVKKVLATFADSHGVPLKGLVKEYKKNMREISQLK